MISQLDIIITDTGPLITLALAKSLNTLALPRLRLIIPDVVMFEATRNQTLPGAQEIIEFTYLNADIVTQQATVTAREYQALLEAGHKPCNMGERAVAEIAERYAMLFSNRAMLLMFEDRDVTKRVLNLPANSYPISTGDFLRSLEQAGLGVNAEETLERARERGRTIARQQMQVSSSRSIDALKSHLKTIEDPGR